MEGNPTTASHQGSGKKETAINQIRNEADYAQWYSKVGDGLLEASFDEYQ